MRTQRFSPAVLVLWFAIRLLAVLTCERLGAVPFTYQGRLLDGNVLANGSYEMRFRIFDLAVAGSQVGGDLLQPSVNVTNGIFTVHLEAEAGVFDGAARWLELAARPAGSADDFGVFNPRQPVTAVPYALFAFSGPGDAGTLTSGTLPDARLSPNIARIPDLLTLSNQLSGQLLVTSNLLQSQEVQLSTRVDQLTAALNSLSNSVNQGVPIGGVLASTDPADSALLGGGLVRFAFIGAPGWKNGSVSGAPSARSSPTAVWTGQEMLVWGGTIGNGAPIATGAGYDPALNQWAPISTLDAPLARSGHGAVWTGQTMLVWGGFTSGYVQTGGEYAPQGPTWTGLPTLSAPAERSGHVAVWTGTRMAIWGGRNSGGLLGDGALYDSVGKTWSALPATDAPAERINATAVWTGTQLLIWGGQGTTGELGSGANLPLTGGSAPGSWHALSGVNAPAARTGHTAIWTGQKMIVWGGQSGGTPRGDGAAYDPATDTWVALPDTDAPASRSAHLAVWTGEEMLVFGGEGASGTLASGGAFDPATGRWRTLSGDGGPIARSHGVAVWTGREMLVFGGEAAGVPLAALQRIDPQPTWYLYRKP